MKSFQQNNRIALGLMGSSLCLLAFFLLFWMHREYQQEVSSLKEKSSFAFINSMKEAEFQFIKKDLLPLLIDLKQHPQDSIRIDAMELTIDKFVTQNNGTQLAKSDSSRANRTTQISVSIRTDSFPAEEQKGGAFLKWLFKTKLLDTLTLSDNPVSRDSLTLLAIKKMLGSSPKIKDLPGYITVVRLEDTAQDITGVLSESYKDLESGETYALALNQTEGYFLKQLLPQLGFSLFLFSITALSFYFVYQSLLKQQQLSTLKNDLISNITHELKTPISTVGVAIEALQNFGALENPCKTKEYLGIAQQELQRLSILVDKVLNTSLVEQTEIPLQRETVQLQPLIATILQSMELKFQEQKASVHFNTAETEGVVQGDKIHLTSVIYNLIDNALKYSPNTPNLTLTLVEKNQQLHFSIQDHGMGIPKEYQHKVFDKFFRVPTANDHSIKGHGLGLNYVRKVIDKHGGVISLSSEVGEGSTFTIILPT